MPTACAQNVEQWKTLRSRMKEAIVESSPCRPMEGFNETLNLLYEIYSLAESLAGRLTWLQIARDLPVPALCALPLSRIGPWAACVSHQLCPTSSVWGGIPLRFFQRRLYIPRGRSWFWMAYKSTWHACVEPAALLWGVEDSKQMVNFLRFRKQSGI